jgi:hypothetical protein
MRLEVVGQHSEQFFQQSHLRRIDLLRGCAHVEELRPINFGKFHLLPRSWRPLHREGVALGGRGIAITFEGPSMNDLAALLLDRLQRDERPGGFYAGFFLELPLGRD